MAETRPAQEPSMEEILSSIRRIIAEDEGAEGGPAAAAFSRPGAEAPLADADDVLELTEVVSGPAPARAPPAEPAAAAASPRPAAPLPRPAAASPRPAVPLPRQESAPMPVDAAESLISAETARASTQALARLTRAGAAEERKPVAGQGPPIEQFLAELLTPMLREWLDRNLPAIVERAVEQEVQKLAKRAELL